MPATLGRLFIDPGGISTVINITGPAGGLLTTYTSVNGAVATSFPNTISTITEYNFVEIIPATISAKVNGVESANSAGGTLTVNMGRTTGQVVSTGFSDSEVATAVAGLATLSTNTTLADGVNIAVGTTTGTKIGTAVGQKLALYNQTPVVQAAAYTQTNSTAARTVANATSSAVTATNDALVGVTYAAPAVTNDALTGPTYDALVITNDALVAVSAVAPVTTGSALAAYGYTQTQADAISLAVATLVTTDIVEVRAVIAELQADMTDVGAVTAELAVDCVEDRAVIAELQADLTATNAALAAAAVDMVEARAVIAELQVDITAVIADNTAQRTDAATLRGLINSLINDTGSTTGIGIHA